MADGTNPETGVTDVDSAVLSLLSPQAGQDKERETEPAQEPEEEPEAVEAADAEDDAEEEDSEELEAADDTDVDDEADPDEAEEEAEDDDPVYTVTVDGEEYEVNLSELRNGYQRQSDYTRKTSQLAEARRAIEGQAEEVKNLRAQLEAELARYAQGDEPEPDWEALADDPWEYTKTRAAWEKKQAERAEAQRKLEASRIQNQQAILQREMQALEQKYPSWKEERGLLKETAQHYGFSEDEFLNATDHRGFLLLRDAARGRQLSEKAKKPPVRKKVQKAPAKALKPGAQSTPKENASRERDALKRKLRRNGDVDTAVEWLLNG